MRSPGRPERFLGIDLGAETLKVAEVLREGERHLPGRTWSREHGKDPMGALSGMLSEIGWEDLSGAAATGRMGKATGLQVVPFQAALTAGLRLLHPGLGSVTLVSIGSHGFSVTDVQEGGTGRTRENSRCSQGTGNFLRQLVERLDLGLPEADQLCLEASPAPLSGRCPVILKTDLTHLANKGVDQGSILAGLYDAVCENVQTLIRTREAGRHLLLIGGVSRSERIRRHFRQKAEAMGRTFFEGDPDRDRFLEAFGAACLAAEKGLPALPPERLGARDENLPFPKLEGFRRALSRVHRMERPKGESNGRVHEVILGFDIGSTGAKALALDIESREPVWDHYTNTLGDPVGATQKLVSALLSSSGLRVRGTGVTGSGREIVGSLLACCFGPDRVFVLNEIAAHAEGALFFDSKVDTIFEIGGQDAKYIRLDGGRVSDAAMNQACSAGTGSFIEEQGGKFERVGDIVQMGRLAMDAEKAVSLGQHCSVFMAEVIDQAVAAGVPTPEILAGLYDSVVQNYLNRVKGSRSIGRRIFCQGMPFMSDALAAAVALRTGREVIVPPNPGTIGALGIALLARKELEGSLRGDLDLRRFLEARVEEKDQFVCRSTKGCGEPGNACKIDRLRIRVEGREKSHLWGGSCALHERGVRKRKLPDLAPNPFREREGLVDQLVSALPRREGRPRIALTDEFALKSLFPFFATFLSELGFGLEILRGGSRPDLARGIQEANVPYCAPMQLFHGLASKMLQDPPDWLFVPMLIEMPRTAGERHSATCPIVQASPGILAQALLGEGVVTKILAPRIEMSSANYDSGTFRRCCRELADRLGARRNWEAALRRAVGAQIRFQEACRNLGERALTFAAEHDLPAIVVLGRGYTIYNDVLNSNVPSLLREQGALAIPVDCYPLEDDTPSFDGMFWHYGQINLRAAHQIRRKDEVYSVYCSNYACGPDSFNLHFYAYTMEGKPFALIETDGHSGDAGTRTRIEAFLYCVEGDLRTPAEARGKGRANSFRRIEQDRQDLARTLERGDELLIPPMGVGAHVVAAALRSEGFRTEVLEESNDQVLALGRRHTSGKECLPMILTAGSLLRRLEREGDSGEKFAFLMPTTYGPCRFGAYNLLHKIILERNGWRDRVRVVSPSDSNYFEGLSGDLTLRLWIGMVATDLLLGALYDVRPVEKRRGAAREIHERYFGRLLSLLEKPSGRGFLASMREVEGDMFGVSSLIRQAAREFSEIKDFGKEIPTIGVVGEIYLRLESFANDFLIERLEALGVRARLAPFHEWIEFTTWWREKRIFEGRAGEGEGRLQIWFCSAVQDRVADRLHAVMGRPLGWGPRPRVQSSIAAGERYVNRALESETILTIGGALHEFLAGEIDGVVSVGPLECMPNKIAESHFQRADPDYGLPSLTLSLNGEPFEDRTLEAFVFEVKERRSLAPATLRARPPGLRTPLKEAVWKSSGRLFTKALGLLPSLPREARRVPPR